MKIEQITSGTYTPTENCQYVITQSGDYTFVLEKENLATEIVCIAKSTDIELAIEVIHKASNTRSNIKVSETVTSNKAVFTGKVIIEATAQGGQAEIAHKVLALGKGFTAVSKPTLELKTQNAQVTHKALITPVDPKELAYLQSRGLSSKEAQTLILEGFYEESLNSIKDATIRDRVKKAYEL